MTAGSSLLVYSGGLQTTAEQQNLELFNAIHAKYRSLLITGLATRQVIHPSLFTLSTGARLINFLFEPVGYRSEENQSLELIRRSVTQVYGSRFQVNVPVARFKGNNRELLSIFIISEPPSFKNYWLSKSQK